MDPDGTNLTQLASFTADGAHYPRWAPDRSMIVFSSVQDFLIGNELQAVSADGGSLVSVVSDTSTWRARFSPDGTHLAFECGDGGYPYSAQDVCVIASVPADVASMKDIGNSTGKTWITDSVSVDLGGSGAFAWNPLNSAQLAVVRDSQAFVGGPNASKIYLVNIDGSGVTPVTPDPIVVGSDPILIHNMDWAPDGSFIAFEGENVTTGGAAIYRVEISDGTVTQLSFPANWEWEYRPVVSPDNSEILFGLDTDGAFLIRMPAGGGSEVQINSTTFSTSLASWSWDWSPDGSEIVHVTDKWTGGGLVIAKVKSTTTSTTYLNDLVLVGRAATAGEIQDRQPTWRP